MADDAELLTVEMAALQGLEVIDLVADWNAGEQIDITLLLEQFANEPRAQDVPDGTVAVADVSSQPDEGPGDVILLDLSVPAALTVLYDDLTLQPHI